MLNKGGEGFAAGVKRALEFFTKGRPENESLAKWLAKAAEKVMKDLSGKKIKKKN